MQSNQHVLINNIDLNICKDNKNEEYSEFQFKKLPSSLIQFLTKKHINIRQLSTSIPRYFRIKPGYVIQLKDLAKDLQTNIKNIVKIDKQFYALSQDVKINNSQLYKQGIIYGMDFSSAIPVRCLELFQGCNVLELCSAPGNKAMYMADLNKNIKIIGVQINQNRSDVMKSLINKYKQADKIKVVVADGVKYNNQQFFDRVLIDAQCTHQGSIKHIKKFINSPNFDKKTIYEKQTKKQKMLTKQQEKQYQKNNSNFYTAPITKKNEWTEQDFQQRFLDAKKLQNLNSLQMGLLQNGFRLLKDQGIIIYSTCSFDRCQNQDIISQFLKKYHNICELIDASDGLQCNLPWIEGDLKGTLRFSPMVSRTGGMFIAKLKKKQHQKNKDN